METSDFQCCFKFSKILQKPNMSLFPAYTGENVQSIAVTSKNAESTDWLSNSSYTGVPISQKVTVDISSDSSSEDDLQVEKIEQSKSTSESDEKVSTDLKRHKKQKNKRKKKQFKREDKSTVNEKKVYYENKTREKVFLNLKSIHSRARPAYDISDKYIGFVPIKRSKRDSFDRYYLIDIDKVVNPKKKNTFLSKKEKKTEKDNNLEEKNKIEEEQKAKVQEFNEQLAKSPDDVATWIEYINFQNDIFKFARFKSQADNQRVTLEKKLSIVNKALEKNAYSTELLALKLQFMSDLLPVDIFSSEVESLLAKDSSNVALWQALITAMRSSVALCNIQRVVELYSRCFKVLRQKLRLSPSTCDSHMLGILYESLTFLRHTGHWEQMWETIKFNLTLNLSISEKSLNFKGAIDEKKLIDLEEVILTSGLPLNQLWLRIESLRERCHWITIDKDQLEFIGDSKRYVLSEDIADFVHPLLLKESNFHLAIYLLLALKVPLLPCRHYVIQNLKLDQMNWSFDSLEILLPLIYPQIGEIKDKKFILKGFLQSHLTSGPQFLLFHPAQEPYLDFVRMVFQAIAAVLPPFQRTSIQVWWLRFERMLIFLGKEDPLKTDTKGKKIKSIVKDFFKKPENRNNLHFYREYALIELEFGRTESCINILQTAIESQGSIDNAGLDEKTALFSIYRSLLEIYFKCKNDSTSAERILQIVTRLVTKNDEQSNLSSVKEYLKHLLQNYLEKESANNTSYSYFMPNLDCDIIACYAYVLYIQQHNLKEIVEMFKKCLKNAKSNAVLQEQLYECQTTVLELHKENNKKECVLVKDNIKEALGIYKNNFYMISVFAEIQSESFFWQLNTGNQNLGFWQAIGLCLAYQARIQKLRSLGFSDSAAAMLNKTLSLYKTLTNIKSVQCCPIIWRLYMLLLREESLAEKKGEEIYHESITNCPWARCIYLNSAEVAPQKLTQIQDVIREKELRIHITPEELDILRG